MHHHEIGVTLGGTAGDMVAGHRDLDLVTASASSRLITAPDNPALTITIFPFPACSGIPFPTVLRQTRRARPASTLPLSVAVAYAAGSVHRRVSMASGA